MKNHDQDHPPQDYYSIINQSDKLIHNEQVHELIKMDVEKIKNNERMESSIDYSKKATAEMSIISGAASTNVSNNNLMNFMISLNQIQDYAKYIVDLGDKLLYNQSLKCIYFILIYNSM